PTQGPVAVAYPPPAPREPDQEYKRRLGIYRPFLMPSRRNVLALLNGPGTTGQNSGLLGQAGVTSRVSMTESDTEFAVGILLVENPAGGQKPAFFDFLRKVQLVQPSADVPASRLVSTAARARENAMRARLRAAFRFAPGAYVAPGLAAALDRLGRCRQALGATTPLTVLRAQDDAGGSRFELGLGVELPVPNATELDAMAAALDSRTIAASADAETRAVLAGMTPALAASDPAGRWLLGPCGLRTVHVTAAGTLYLSHFPVFGMTVAFPPGPGGRLEARFQADGDGDLNVVLAAALADATTDWAAAGGAARTLLPAAQAPAARGSSPP